MTFPVQLLISPLSIIITFCLLVVINADDGAEAEISSTTTAAEELEIKAENTTTHVLHGISIAEFDFKLVKTPYIIALWIFAASVAKLGFHLAPSRLHSLFPESCLLIVIGLIVGAGLALVGSGSTSMRLLTPGTFFNFLLPPIILDAGYFMPNKLFFDNLGTILLMAVVGTFWNTFSIGLSLWGVSYAFGGFAGRTIPLLQCLLFSSLISAVDPVAVLAVFEEIHVNEVLYIIVFGESLLNDAVTVALYEMFESYAIMGPGAISASDVLKGVAKFPVVSLGGTLIGVLAGFAIGLITRFTANTRVMEPLLIFVMAYIAYLTAEMFHLSGIMAATFCGMTMKNYVKANISLKSLTTLKYSTKMLSSGAETIIFILFGVSTITGGHEWNTSFIIATLIFCAVYRAIGTFGLCAFANYFRLTPIGGVDQFVIAYGGLRGAVAVALALLIDKNATLFDEGLRGMMVTTTMAVIYFTVFVQGMTIKPIVEWLHVSKSEKIKPTMNERLHEKAMEHIMAGMESVVGHIGKYNLRAKLRFLDETYVRPLLIRNYKEGVLSGARDPKIMETYAKLTMEDMKTVIKIGGEKFRRQDSVLRAKKRLHIDDEAHSNSTSPTIQNHINAIEVEAAKVAPKADALLAHMLNDRRRSAFRNARSYSRHSFDEKDEPMLAIPVFEDVEVATNEAKIAERKRALFQRKWQTVDVEDGNTEALLSQNRRRSAGELLQHDEFKNSPTASTSGRKLLNFSPKGSSSIPELEEKSDEETET